MRLSSACFFLLLVVIQCLTSACGRFGSSLTATSFGGSGSGSSSGSGSGGGSSPAGFDDRYSLSYNGANGFLQVTSASVTAYPFTIAAWVRTISATDQTIMALYDSAASNRYYRIRFTSTGNIRAECSNTTNRTSTFASNFADGTWHFVVGVFTSSTSRMVYVDGVNAAVNTNNCAFFSPNQIVIGRNAGTAPNFYFNGYISEASIWDVALSAPSISDLYHSGDPIDLSQDSGNYTNSADLLGWWRMGDHANDSAATSIYDATGLGYTLTTFGMNASNLTTIVP